MIRGAGVPECQNRAVTAINIAEVSAAPWFIRLLLRPGSPTEGLLPASRTVRAARAKQRTEDEEPEMITDEGLQVGQQWLTRPELQESALYDPTSTCSPGGLTRQAHCRTSSTATAGDGLQSSTTP